MRHILNRSVEFLGTILRRKRRGSALGIMHPVRLYSLDGPLGQGLVQKGDRAKDEVYIISLRIDCVKTIKQHAAVVAMGGERTSMRKQALNGVTLMAR